MKKVIKKIKKISHNAKKALKKPWLIALIGLFLIIGTVSAGAGLIKNNGRSPDEDLPPPAKQVRTAIVDLGLGQESYIDAVGTVRAKNRVDVVATTPGTLKALLFEVGDRVLLNQLLATLYDNTTLTNVNNARTNLINTQSGLLTTQRITEESVRQAEIGVAAAEESVRAAEIGLETARDNLANAQALTSKGNEDAKNSAIAAYNGFQNTIFSALDQSNALLKIEDASQGSSGSQVYTGLSAENPPLLTRANSLYLEADQRYENLLVARPDSNNITALTADMVETLAAVESLVGTMLQVLDNTVSGNEFPQASLDAQKSNFIALRSSVVASLSSAKSTLQGLENLGLLENQETTALENAVEAAESQLAIARNNLDNARVSLDNAKRTREQQLLNSQSAVDNARGQLNLTQAQASDLAVRAPISGRITRKFVDLGAELSPGQKITEISQTNELKIEVSLPSEDVYRIDTGDTAIIGDGLAGLVESIDPAADPVTRKVKVEILYDNSDQSLIPGTFIDVSLPARALEKTHDQSVYVPLRAVTITQNESFVFVAGDGRAKKVPVAVGRTEGALVEILDGLNNGDVLVVDNNKSLNDGDSIEIIPNE